MEIVILEIVNGYLLIHEQQTVFCKDAAALHKELEFTLKPDHLPEAPKPPATKARDGSREFDDED